MDSWVLWIVVACGFGIGELLTMGFFLAPFAIGGLLATLLSLAGAGGAVDTTAFVGSGFAALLVLRPVAMRHRRLPPLLRTGSAALVGRKGVVLERIANHEAVGCVKIDGEVWTARAYDDDHVIEAGRSVEIVAIRGATAVVIDYD